MERSGTILKSGDGVREDGAKKGFTNFQVRCLKNE